jgi:hypothetical protein
MDIFNNVEHLLIRKPGCFRNRPESSRNNLPEFFNIDLFGSQFSRIFSSFDGETDLRSFS